ncbi:hypothetical protein BG004_006323 [Podila humilis]|nr:hypothetical protein BG004_006323 [Podila humilis]
MSPSIFSSHSTKSRAGSISRSSSGTQQSSYGIARTSSFSSTRSGTSSSFHAMGPKPFSPFKILIVGAGVGGLMLGYCLEQAGIEYVIVDKMKGPPTTESTIQMTGNTLRAIEQLGLLDEVMRFAKPVSSIVLRRPNMSTVGKIDTMYLKERYGHHSCIVQRSEFIHLLLSKLPKKNVQWDRRVLEVVSGDMGVQCRCSNGHVEQGDILIGADGAHSSIRQNLYRTLREKNILPKSDTEPLRHTQNSIIGMTESLCSNMYPAAGAQFSEVNIIVGKEDGGHYTLWLSPASHNRIVWSVTGELLTPGDVENETFRQSEYGAEAIDAACSLIQNLKTPYGGTLAALIAQTRRDHISKVMIEEKHYKTRFYGRTVLIGEACHKFVPFSGQGAEQAILDAVCLVNLLYKLDRNSLTDITRAFQTYQERRHHILKTALSVSNYMSNLMDSQGLSGEIKRTITFNMPSWVKSSSTDKIQVRPLLDFLPAVDDRGSKSVSTKSARQTPNFCSDQKSGVLNVWAQLCRVDCSDTLTKSPNVTSPQFHPTNSPSAEFDDNMVEAHRPDMNTVHCPAYSPSSSLPRSQSQSKFSSLLSPQACTPFLPHELLVKIFYNLEQKPQHRHSSTCSISFSSSLSLDRADVLSCALVCQDWYYAAVDALWRDIELQSVESFIHFSRALEPTFSYCGETDPLSTNGPKEVDNVNYKMDDDRNRTKPHPPGSSFPGYLQTRDRAVVTYNDTTLDSESAATATRSATTNGGSSCIKVSMNAMSLGTTVPTSIGPMSPCMSSASSLSIRSGVHSSLDQETHPGLVGYAGKGFIRKLSLAGSSDCQAPRPFPHLPACITDNHLASLSPYLTHLTALDLAHCSGLSDVTIIGLVATSSPYLKKIDLTGCRLITDLTVCVIARLCSQLEEISLHGCGLVTNDSIEELATHCPRLQNVDISQCQRAGDRAVIALFNISGQVNTTGLHGAPQDSIVPVARAKRARISRLGIAGCRGITMVGLMAIGRSVTGTGLNWVPGDVTSKFDAVGDDPDEDITLEEHEHSSLLSLEFACPPAVPPKLDPNHFTNAQTMGQTLAQSSRSASSPIRRFFRSLPSTLEEITIHDAHCLNHDDVLCLVQRLGQSLKVLRLDNGNAVTSETLGYILGECPKLTVLCIPRATRLDDTGVMQLATAQCASTLIELDLSASLNLTDACLTRVALLPRELAASVTQSSPAKATSLFDMKDKGKGKGKGKGTKNTRTQESPCLFPNLRRLDLSYNGKLTLTGIIPLVMSLPSLCSLDVSFCGDGVTRNWGSSLETLRVSLSHALQSTLESQRYTGLAADTPASGTSSSPPQHQSYLMSGSTLSILPLQYVTGATVVPTTISPSLPAIDPVPNVALTFTPGTWRRGVGHYTGPRLNGASTQNNIIPQHQQQYPSLGNTDNTVNTSSPALTASSTSISQRRFSSPGSYPADSDNDGQECRGGSSSSTHTHANSRRFSAPLTSSTSTMCNIQYDSRAPIHLASRTDILERTPQSMGIGPTFHLESWFTPLHQLQLQQLFHVQLQHQRELQIQVAAAVSQGFQHTQQIEQGQLMQASALAAASSAAAVLSPELMNHPVMTATRAGVAIIGGSTASAELFDMHAGEQEVERTGPTRQLNVGARGRRSSISDSQPLHFGNSGSRRRRGSAGEIKSMTMGDCEISGWGLSMLREEWAHSAKDMTRYTKLERKRHVDAGEAFAVTPLQPKKSQSSVSAPTPTPTPTPTPGPSSTTTTTTSSTTTSSTTEPSKSKTDTNNTDNKRKAENGEKLQGGRANKKSKQGKGNGETKGDQDKTDKSERRRLRRQKERSNGSVCFACRKTGHSAKNCKETSGVGMCYSCGSLEHTTKDCKKLNKDGNKFKFATCFVCKETGHLASACPQNEKGLYPKGGSCRFCNKVDHLAKDCTLTKDEVGTVTLGKIDLVQGADDDDFHIFVDEKRKLGEEQKTIKKMVKAPPKPAKKVVSF